VAASKAGKNAKCPACETPFRIPAKQPAAAARSAGDPTPAAAPAQETSPPVSNDLFDFIESNPPPVASPAAITPSDLNAAPPPKVKYPAPKKNHPFALEKRGIEKGMFGGIAMMAIAAAWFVVGLMCNRIFFYPPILFVIGLFAFVKGLATGNIAGKK
jgi:hypothetical protein